MQIAYHACQAGSSCLRFRHTSAAGGHMSVKKDFLRSGIGPIGAALAIVATCLLATQSAGLAKPRTHQPTRLTAVKVAAPPALVIDDLQLSQMPPGLAVAQAPTAKTYTIGGKSITHTVATVLDASPDGAATDGSGPQGAAITISVSRGDPNEAQLLYEGTLAKYSGTQASVAGGSAFIFSPADGWTSVIWVSKSGDLVQVSGVNEGSDLLQEIANDLSPAGSTGGTQ